MKKTLYAVLILSVFFFINLVFGQTAKSQDTEILLGSEIRHGGYGAPIFGVTSVNGQPTYLRGTRGAWVIKFDNTRSINLGLASYRTRTHFDPVGWNETGLDEPELRTNYSGFEIEYVHNTHRLFHYSLQTLIGSGTVRFDDRDLELDKTRDSYFVLQPGVNINLNVTNWFRLSGGFFYRYAGNVNLEGTSNSDLSGLASFFSLRFGRF